MSMPIIDIYCSKCNFSKILTSGGKVYKYELPDGKQITAPSAYGWCTQCKTITIIHLGLSTTILSEEIEELNKTLLFLEMVPDSSNSLNIQVRNIKYNIEEKNKYFAILDGKTSKHLCHTCGNVNVYPYFHLRGHRGLKPEEDTSYSHLDCGGRLRVRESEIRVAYTFQEIIVKPLFDPILNESDLIIKVARAYNNLNYNQIAAIASENIVYESQEVFSALNGKDEVIDYFIGKFETIKKSCKLVFAEIGFIGEDRPCIIMSQGKKENKVALIIIETENSKLKRIDICTIAPHWTQATGTNEYPK